MSKKEIHTNLIGRKCQAAQFFNHWKESGDMDKGHPLFNAIGREGEISAVWLDGGELVLLVLFPEGDSFQMGPKMLDIQPEPAFPAEKPH